MSYFLHHCEDASPHLHKTAALLPHGGRLYVLDRVALDESALAAFPQFWDESYHAAHEWLEEMPHLMTVNGLVQVANEAGFAFVGRQVCPHDRRAGAERFPKTLMEFWRHETGNEFPAILVVSPAHQAVVDDVVTYLAADDLRISARHTVPYSDDLIRAFYKRCPWREQLLRFVAEMCPSRFATVLSIAGNSTTPDLLNRLGRFKKNHRDRWQSIDGPMSTNGFRPIILPFHVAEPYESEELASLVRAPIEGQ